MSAHQLRDLADLAWARYMHWLGRLAVPRTSQLDLLDAPDLGAQVREWRGIAVACERELVRREAIYG